MNKLTSVEWNKGIDFAGVESIGARSSQEDYSLFRVFNSQNGIIAILSDGMGGHAAGEIASKNAVIEFDKTFHIYPAESIAVKLGASLSEANRQIYKLIASDSALRGMGCTLIGAYIDKNGIQWISVGDSLLYVYRNKKLSRLNADHSMAPLIEESVRSGKISKREAENYPNKNALRSAVMGEDIPLIDAPATPTRLLEGDIIIIASDGILTLADKQIESTLLKVSSLSAEEIATTILKEVALQNKVNQDNTTIQIVKIPKSLASHTTLTKKFLKITLTFLIFIISILAYLFLFKKDIIELGENSSHIPPISIPAPTPTPSKIEQPKVNEQIAPLPESLKMPSGTGIQNIQKGSDSNSPKNKSSDKKLESRSKGKDANKGGSIGQQNGQGSSNSIKDQKLDDLKDGGEKGNPVSPGKQSQETSEST